MGYYPIENYILVPPKGSLPAAEVAYRDQICMIRGAGAGDPDRLWLCRATGSGYEWVELTGPDSWLRTFLLMGA